MLIINIVTLKLTYFLNRNAIAFEIFKNLIYSNKKTGLKKPVILFCWNYITSVSLRHMHRQRLPLRPRSLSGVGESL